MKKLTFLAGAALLGLAGTALAQPAAPPRGERNADVTRQQVIERTQQRFARLDLNRDGNVTRAEFDQARGQMREHRAERRAEHGPGRGMRGRRGMHRQGMFGQQGFVTREQFEQRALARFDRLDADRNGTLTAAERQQARETMRQRFRERRGRNG